MLAQQHLYTFLRGRRRVSTATLPLRVRNLPGYDPELSYRLQDAYNANLIVAFEDGSYLEYRPEVGTWVAFHERWERK